MSISNQYVGDLYTTILQRLPSAAELPFWTAPLDAGTLTPQQEVAAIENSTEATNFVDPVIRLYQGLFLRAPDPSGLQYWAKQLRSGAMTLAQVAASFTSSNEFTADFGASPTAVGFVNALYLNILGRSADSTGLAYWTAQLTTVNATTEAGVVLGFTQSNEFQADTTNAINNWLAIAVADGQNGNGPIYPDVIPGGTQTLGHAVFNLTPSASTITGSGHGGDTINAFVINNSTTGGQDQTFTSAVSITESGLNNVLNATIQNPGTFSPIINGVQTWTLSSIPTPSVTTGLAGSVIIDAGANVSGVTTINDFYSAGGNLTIGVTGQALQTALTNVALDGIGATTFDANSLTLDIAAAALSGAADTLNIAINGPTNVVVPALATQLHVGPDSGTNGYETFAITATGNNTLSLSQNATGAPNAASYSATEVTVEGSGNLTLGTDVSANWNSLATIDASTATGNIVILGAANGTTSTAFTVAGLLSTDTALTTLKGGAGNDYFDISNLTTVAAVNAITTLDGGGGVNILALNSAIVEGTTVLNQVSNFQTFADVDPGRSGGVINWANLGSADALVFLGGGPSQAMTINNAPTVFTLSENRLGNPLAGITVNGPNGLADTMNLTIDQSLTPGGPPLSIPPPNSTGAPAINGFETINITGSGTIAALTATPTAGAGETLNIGGFNLTITGAVALAGTTTAINITDTNGVLFSGTVSAATINAAASGGLAMNQPDINVNGTTGDTIIGSATGHNQILGSVGNDTITGGSAGDGFATEGGADTITLAATGGRDLVGLTVLANSAPVPGSIVAASGTDSAQPGFWGLAPDATPAPQGGLSANTGTSADQSTIANFQAGTAGNGDALLFSVQEWGASGANLGLVNADLATRVAGVMTSGVTHIGGTVAANVNLIELTDATFANANAMVAALHSGAYGINFAAPLAAANDFAHLLVAYADAGGNTHIADLDITGAASAASTALTERASDMVQLTGVALSSLVPNNVTFIA